MKVSLSWLKNYVTIDLSPQDIAGELTMAGMEINSMQIIGREWSDIIVGLVIDVNPHPNADRLNLATIDLGSHQITVVCGAPNISPGQKIAFARVGARLIDGFTGKPVTLKQAKIRGVVSGGMVCSEKELGISNNHEEILVLNSEATVGMPLVDYLGDVIFDLEVTPNRPDCLCVIGIAREIGALTNNSLSLPQIIYPETEEAIGSYVSVEIDDADSCPRYCASVITGVELKPSPSWMQRYLTSYGMRPINNIVDITNYVMLEYGQPLHAFDYNRIKGHSIIVRKATDGECITTLDGLKRVLSHDIMVIADADNPVAVAGIMGGLDAEVTENTTAILLEAASFNRVDIRRGSSHLGLQSEASVRFDKGLSAELSLIALKRATQLLQELANGKVAKGIIDRYPGQVEPKPIDISSKEVKRLSGLEVSDNEISRILTLLGFKCQKPNLSSSISVLSPYWRSDISCTADLVEEVVRIIGYDQIPITRLSSRLPKQVTLFELEFRNNLKERFINCGFQEVLTYSLTSLQKLQNIHTKHELQTIPLKVINPMTKEQEYLRTSLRPNIFSTLAINQKYEQNGVKLFEIGKVFLAHQDSNIVIKNHNENNKFNEEHSLKASKILPQEKEMLCAVINGPRDELGWQSDRGLLGFFDAKGVVENILSSLRVKATFNAGDDESLLLGSCANIFVGDEKIGVLGIVHPRIAQYFELSGDICLVEMDIEKLRSKVDSIKHYQTIARYPGMMRDMAIVVDSQINFKAVKDIICSFTLVKQAVLFDLYTGEQVAAGRKSFAVRIVYQSPDHTLTDDEVDETADKMLKRLQDELGACLRS
jgi:phenylalanyl-tRNA synthetase beta chain